MYTYSSKNYNQTGAFYRLIDTMKRAKKNNRPFTIFIGAGCSLTSSKRSISTEQVILDSLRDHFDSGYKHPGNWEGLYRDFVNNVWGTLGEADRREILEDYFLDLIPSDGYKNLKILIENGYISNIITTNFDMLLDDLLQGLAYNIKVGQSSERKIKGGSFIHLLKVHGDIENGQLRFSPDELVTLPENIQSCINHMTLNNCLVCGYSGQDIGVMKSLSFDSEYSVYWASPHKPIKSDIFDSKMIYDWMEKRHSDINFIFGELGKFDNLMKTLVSAILDIKPIRTENLAWQGSTIIDSLKINYTVYRMFQDILECSNVLSQEFNWKIKFPFYSSDYETTLNAFLYYYKKTSNLPNSFLQAPENEIEALLVGVILDVIAHTSGLEISAYEYITRLQNKFKSTISEYQPDLYFWQAAKKILALCNNDFSVQLTEDIPQIKLKLNQTGLLTFNMEKPQLNYLADIISTLNICGLFVPTYDDSKSIDSMSESKLLLQSVSENYDIDHDPITFHLGKIEADKFKGIYHIFFKDKKFIYNDSGTIVGPHIIISAQLIEPEKSIKAFDDLFDYLYTTSNNETTSYMKNKSAFELNESKYVPLRIDYEIDKFIKSTKRAMYIIGTSGSGKTNAIKNLISKVDRCKYIIYAFSPKFCKGTHNTGLQEFFPDLFLDENSSEQKVIRDISLTLELRKKYLILIYEGLNESYGGFESCSARYKGLSNSIDYLQELDIKNIKLIITCRDHIFEEYCEETGSYPTIESCYCKTNINTISPYYRMSTLSLDEQKEIAKAYFVDSNQLNCFVMNLENNISFKETFNQPYLIALAAKHFNSKFYSNAGISVYSILSKFTKQMIRQLSNRENISFAYELFKNYFMFLVHTKPFNRRITKFVLINSFDTEQQRKKAAIVLTQLNDVNIFTSNNYLGYVHFTHDRIEEHLLTEFFYMTASDGSILEEAISIANEDQIFYFAIQNYFKRCINEHLFDQILNNFENWYTLNSNTLPTLLVGGLEDVTQNDLIHLFNLLCIQYNKIEQFMQILIEGIKYCISSKVYGFPEKLFDEFPVLSKLFPILEQFEQQLFFLASRYYYIQKNDLELSQKYCDLALKAHISFQNFICKVKFQEAILLDKKGNIDDAIYIFSKLYSDFVAYNDFESATECILEWGGALREKTLFSDAIKIYEKADIEFLNGHPNLYAKLLRRIGTIYKNQMQQITQDSINSENLPTSADREEAIKLYQLANKQFELALSKVSDTNDIIEKMKILSEQTENALRILPILPEQRFRADYCHRQEADLLAIAPIPDKKILYLRECAIFNEIDHQYMEALENLLKAKKIASEKGLVYRQFEVNYQIGHLVEHNKDILNKEECLLGIQALDNALEINLDDSNIYFLSCLAVKKSLSDYVNAKYN